NLPPPRRAIPRPGGTREITWRSRDSTSRVAAHSASTTKGHLPALSGITSITSRRPVAPATVAPESTTATTPLLMTTSSATGFMTSATTTRPVHDYIASIMPICEGTFITMWCTAPIGMIDAMYSWTGRVEVADVMNPVADDVV